MGAQELIIALKEEETFQAAKFRATLKEVDYTVRNIRIKVSGEVATLSEKKSDKFSDLALKVDNQVFFVLSEKSGDKESEEQWAKHRQLIAELRQAINAGKQKLTLVGQSLEVIGDGEGILLEQISD